MARGGRPGVIAARALSEEEHVPREGQLHEALVGCAQPLRRRAGEEVGMRPTRLPEVGAADVRPVASTSTPSSAAAEAGSMASVCAGHVGRANDRVRGISVPGTDGP
ncbi:hypothetical protein MAFF212519_01460 [Clavibacter michiganensis]